MGNRKAHKAADPTLWDYPQGEEGKPSPDSSEDREFPKRAPDDRAETESAGRPEDVQDQDGRAADGGAEPQEAKVEENTAGRPTDDDPFGPTASEAKDGGESAGDDTAKNGHPPRVWPSLNRKDPHADVLENLADLRQPDRDAMRPLWWDLVYPGSVAIVAGAPSIGKTTFVMRVAATIAAGAPASFLGWPGPVGGADVLAIDFETPESVLVQAWDDAFADYLYAKSRVTICKAENEIDVEYIAEFVREKKIRLILIDTLSAAFNFEEIKSNSETEAKMRTLRRLVRSTRASVLANAHTPKGRTDLIGAQAQKAVADVVKFYEQFGKGKDGIIRYRLSGEAIGGARGKSRFGENRSLTFTRAGAGHFDLAESGDSYESAKASVAKVSKFLRARGDSGATTTEIVQGTDVSSRTTVQAAIRELREGGRVRTVGLGKATRFYFVAERSES